MAKKKSSKISLKTLGTLLIAGLIAQYIFPAIQLGSLAWLGTAVVLFVAVYLIFVR